MFFRFPLITQGFSIQIFFNWRGGHFTQEILGLKTTISNYCFLINLQLYRKAQTNEEEVGYSQFKKKNSSSNLVGC